MCGKSVEQRSDSSLQCCAKATNLRSGRRCVAHISGPLTEVLSLGFGDGGVLTAIILETLGEIFDPSVSLVS